MWEPKHLNRTIANDRKRGAAQPSPRLAKRFLVQKETVTGFDVFTLTPKNSKALRNILYLHGGGFALSINELHWQFIETMAGLLDAAVTVPIYPLAPEHDIDATLAMMVPLYKNLASAHTGKLTLMGDSSGANLALLLAMIARDEGYSQASQLVLISPGLDFSFSNPAQIEIDKTDPILDLRGLKMLGLMRAGRYDIFHPKISPLFGELHDLPNMAICTGTRDLTNPDAKTLHAKLIELGATPMLFEYPEMLHVWPLFPLPEARRVQGQIVDFVLHADARQ